MTKSAKNQLLYEIFVVWMKADRMEATSEISEKLKKIYLELMEIIPDSD